MICFELILRFRFARNTLLAKNMLSLRAPIFREKLYNLVFLLQCWLIKENLSVFCFLFFFFFFSFFCDFRSLVHAEFVFWDNWLFAWCVRYSSRSGNKSYRDKKRLFVCLHAILMMARIFGEGTKHRFQSHGRGLMNFQIFHLLLIIMLPAYNSRVIDSVSRVNPLPPWCQRFFSDRFKKLRTETESHVY